MVVTAKLLYLRPNRILSELYLFQLFSILDFQSVESVNDLHIISLKTNKLIFKMAFEDIISFI